MVKKVVVVVWLIYGQSYAQFAHQPTFSLFAARPDSAPSAVSWAYSPGPSSGAVPQANLPSRGQVFFKSLLIPGWGQLTLGAKTAARHFLLAELTLWGTVLAFNAYGNWLRQDYRTFAFAHAQVTPGPKDRRYWVDIGNFDSIYDYNQEKLRQRNVKALRNPDGDEFWQWDSPENRAFFEELRIRSDKAFERRNFSIVGVLLNHLTSAIHAMWVRKKALDQASVSPEGNLRFVWQYDSQIKRVQMSIYF